MPKYCKAAHCFNYAGQLSADNRKLSFYKFPLHNKERLHQWLISMKREKMVPTKHQHLCSEHFTPSCFEWRWGVRYLKPDAVPTIFQHTGNRRKKKEISRSGVRKKFVFESRIACTSPEQTILVPSLSEKNLEAFTFAIDPCHTPLPFYIGPTQTSSKDYDVDKVSTPVVGTVNLIPVVQIVEPLKDSAANLSSTAETVSSPLQISHSVAKNQLDFPVALPIESGESYLAVESGEFTESASMSYECTAPAENSACSTSFILKEASAAYDTNERNWPGALIIENVSIEPVSEVDPSTSNFTTVQMLTQMDAVSTVASPGKTGSLTLVTVLPETVLSSAITAPIVSTVPIVSNHAKLLPGPGQCARQKASARLEESQLNILKEQQLEEPMHLENSVTNEQLVAIALSLQKKVKLLQQRHRRHRSKIKSMERIVEGLRKENLISEEKLKILETACLQSNTDAPESVDAVAILCQEEACTLVYAMPQSQHEESESVLHLEEKQHIE